MSFAQHFASIIVETTVGIMGLYRNNGKENGHYHSSVIKGYI